MVGPLRGGKGVTPPTTKQKTTFFYKWRKFTGKLHNENIILYDILVQIFTSVHPILSVYIFTGSKTIFAKK